MLSVRYLTYSQFHNKQPVVGSTNIRVNQLIKYWPEAKLYRYGENPDVMVFQKVYCADDYQFPVHFEGIKILDICDPDWLEGMAVAEMARAMDAITCPTETLAEFMRQLTPAPVYVVPDRWDVKKMKRPREHTGPAKTVVWFGYSHNAELLKPALHVINELGLKLIVISNDDPIIHRFDVRPKQDYYTFRRYTHETIDDEIRKADIAVLPGDFRPQGRFKSNNKTTRAILNGLPVATDADSLRKLIDVKERRKYMQEHYDKIRLEYDVRKSVKQMQHIIEVAQKRHHG